MQHAGRAAPVETGDAGSRILIDSLVAHGLRAELKTGNLLTGQKFVALDMYRDAPKDRVGWMEQPAIFPTISGGLDDIQDSVGVIAKKLSKVPFDQLSVRLMNAMASLDQTLKRADHLLQNVDGNLAPQVQSTLAEAQAALKNAKELLGQDAPLENDSARRCCKFPEPQSRSALWSIIWSAIPNLCYAASRQVPMKSLPLLVCVLILASGCALGNTIISTCWTPGLRAPGNRDRSSIGRLS